MTPSGPDPQRLAVLRRLQHENVVSAPVAGGTTLRALLGERRLSDDEVRALGRALTHAVLVTQRLGIAHGDLTPDRVWLRGGVVTDESVAVEYGAEVGGAAGVDDRAAVGAILDEARSLESALSDLVRQLRSPDPPSLEQALAALSPPGTRPPSTSNPAKEPPPPQREELPPAQFPSAPRRPGVAFYVAAAAALVAAVVAAVALTQP